MNASKTEEYKISRNDHEWKNCRFLGSLLGTEEEIKRRKGLAIGCLKSKKKFFSSKRLTLKNKAKLFNTYVGSIFLFNSELWTLTARDEKKIDSFQRRLLRSSVLKCKWPKIIKNDDVYRLTKQKPWTETIRLYAEFVGLDIWCAYMRTPLQGRLSIMPGSLLRFLAGVRRPHG